MKHTSSKDHLVKAILSLSDKEECVNFLEDILTIKETDSMAQRLEVAMLLKEGKKFQEIVEKTGASTATISRVNRCILYGNGGYETVINKIKPKEK